MLTTLRQLIGDHYVLTQPEDTAPYLTDWRKRYTGKSCAVVLPGSTQEVAQVVQCCMTHRISIVPQGGNTSLSGGATPDQSGTQLIISLKRINRIRAIDPLNQTITAEAGCLLQTIQDAAKSVGYLFPLSLASEGSCTIGGNLSTNAGGTAVLRYGNMREQCLGLEVVTAQGDIWHGLRGLRKDNTGYDLRNLFIGAEGTLGIITAAVLKLTTRPSAQITTLVGLENTTHALDFLHLAQKQCGNKLTGYELMSHTCMSLIREQYPALHLPFLCAHPHIVLLELSDTDSQIEIHKQLEWLLEKAMTLGLLRDALIAQSLEQSQRFWTIREHIPLAQAQEGTNIKHDIALPISHINDFLAHAERALKRAYPHCRLLTFGHLGDGNLHYNVAPASGESHGLFLTQESAINAIVYDAVHRFGGTISAEHGIGQLKKELLTTYKTNVEINLMRDIKKALDPYNIFNPGKVL